MAPNRNAPPNTVSSSVGRERSEGMGSFEVLLFRTSKLPNPAGHWRPSIELKIDCVPARRFLVARLAAQRVD
jgi:hypothetical protein